MVDLEEVFKTPKSSHNEALAKMIDAMPTPEPTTERIPVNLSIKQAKRLISLHDQLAQVYQDIPHCAEVSANHRREARAIDKMMKAHLKGRDGR